MQPLLLGEDPGRPGHSAIRHDHGDVRPVHLPGRAVQHLQIRSTHRCAAVTVASMLALDHPSSPVGVCGFHVRPQVTATADALSVLAPIAMHQVTYGVLELPVMETVQLPHGVPQPPGSNLLPLSPLSPLMEPHPAARRRDDTSQEQHPPVSKKPVHHRHDEGDGSDYRHQDKQQICVGATPRRASPGRTLPRRSPPGRRPAASHRCPLGDGNRMGYDTVGSGFLILRLGALSKRIG